MLIESQPQQSTTPPTPQLAISQSMSSPAPHGQYDMIERLKQRIGGYRAHHQITCEKNQKTVEAQNIKMKAETNRLTQQFLSNNQNNTNTNNKSKQQKSVNTSGGQRNANKRANAAANNTEAKCDSSEAKPSKMSKVANNRNTSAKDSVNNQSFRNNCAKFNPNSQSIQMDVKLKPSVDMSTISATSQTLLMNSSTSSAPEIKREVIDNSYFRSATVEQIHDYLKDNNTNAFPPNGFETFNADDIKDILNDPSLGDDGFGLMAHEGFGDADFIKQFLEDINDSTYNEVANFGQLMTATTFKGQQPVTNHMNNLVNTPNGFNCNNGANQLSANLSHQMSHNHNQNNMMNQSSNAINSMPFMSNSMQTQSNNEMNSYHPIQPRLQPNLMSNIPNRSSLQMNSSQQTLSVNNNQIRHYISPGNVSPQTQTSQLLIQQQVMPQQPLSTGSMAQHSLQAQQQQSVHVMRLPNNASIQKMTNVAVVSKSPDMSGQLSIQVSPQTQQMPTTTSAQVPQSNAQSAQAATNASIKLKQMAQQVQQKTATHHWVITHSNPPLNQQPIAQQMPQQMRPQTTPAMVAQRMPAQAIQQRQVNQMVSPEQNGIAHTQKQMPLQMQQNQSQNYFGQQMPQQMYWQNNQHNTQHNSQPINSHNHSHSQQHLQPLQQTQSPIPSQVQSQPGAQPPPQAIGQQNMQQNQQNFANYWSQMGQMAGQQTPQQQQQQQQQTQQSQHYFNNNNYNYF